MFEPRNLEIVFSVCSLARVAVNKILKSILGRENSDDKSYDLCAFLVCINSYPLFYLK